MAQVLPDTNIGLVGHVDHGKTTLTSALSGKWTDTHSEELKRGITIKLGYADIEIRKTKDGKFTNVKKDGDGADTELVRKLSLVDAPGHETLMAVMISGAAIMDGAILLVAANEECPQPQTSEHLTALKTLGVENIIVVQNKVDLVTETEAHRNYNQIKKFVEKTLGREVPIIPLSAQKQVNVDLLIEAIDHYFKTPEERKQGDPEMVIARSFDVNKPGSNIDKILGGVLGGAIISGEFKDGDEIEIKPGIKDENRDEWHPVYTKILSIASGKEIVGKKGPGGTVALSTSLDPAVSSSDGLVGNLIGIKDKLPETLYNLDLEVTLFDHIIGIEQEIKIDHLNMNEPIMVSAGTSTTLGIVTQIGTNARMQLRRPICAHKGSKVALSRRVGSRWHLIGFGLIK